MQDIIGFDPQKILRSNSQKMNVVLIIAVLMLLLLVYLAYRTDINPPDYVCTINQEGLEQLVILKNLSIKLTDSQMDSLSNDLEKIINTDLKTILKEIFGENGEGTTVICNYSCEDCCNGGAETSYKYVCCNGAIVDSFEECSDNSLECCEGEPQLPEEECLETGYPCETDSDCCDELECDDGYCTPCTCSETDSGNDPYNYGQTTGWWTPTNECTKKSDHCSGNTLEEYYCGADGYMKKTTYECEYACEDGECTTTPPAEPDCLGEGDYCDLNNDECCDGYECAYYLGMGEICIPEGQCSEWGGPCASAADCCNDYTCSYGYCDYCDYEGYSCDTAYGDTCCDGYVCLGGSCYSNPQ